MSLAVALTLALAGCGAEGAAEPPLQASGSTPQPGAPPVPEGTGGVTVTPAAASPGENIELRFDHPEQVRGIAWSLADAEGIAYYLTSSVYGEGEPTWWGVDDGEGRGWSDVGVGGPGPDLLTVPDTATPGEYLLCTANSVHELCAALTVEG